MKSMVVVIPLVEFDICLLELEDVIDHIISGIKDLRGNLDRS